MPIAEIGSCLVGTLEEGEEHFIRIVSLPHCFIGQNELSHLGAVESLFWLDGIVLESLRCRVGISVKNRVYHCPTPWPEATATHLMRVCLSRYPIRHVGNPTWMLWSTPPRKASHGEVKAAPKKVYRTAFTDKTRTERCHNPVCLHKNTPETLCVLRIVSGMLVILLEGDWLLYFLRYRPNPNFDVDRTQCTYNLLVKICYRAGNKRNCAGDALASLDL